jgi:hypothetical protein
MSGADRVQGTGLMRIRGALTVTGANFLEMPGMDSIFRCLAWTAISEAWHGQHFQMPGMDRNFRCLAWTEISDAWHGQQEYHQLLFVVWHRRFRKSP